MGIISRQLLYLQAMGIPLWQQRNQETQVRLETQNYQLCDAAGVVRGVLLVMREELQLTDAVQLLNKMMGAMQLNVQVADESLEEILQHNHQPKTIIMLGSVLANAFLVAEKSIDQWRALAGNWQNVPVVVSFSLAELLQESSLKKGAWSDLQQAMQLMGVAKNP